MVLNFISQMALSPVSGKDLALTDEQSVTYSSRAGSPSRTRLTTKGPRLCALADRKITGTFCTEWVVRPDHFACRSPTNLMRNGP